MKKTILALAIAFCYTASAQTPNVGIGTAPLNDPDASAELEVRSTTQGFLVPRMTTAERGTIPTPAEGLLIYNEDDNCLQLNRSTDVNAPEWVCILLRP